MKNGSEMELCAMELCALLEKSEQRLSFRFFVFFFEKVVLATIKSLYEKSCGLRKSHTGRSTCMY